MENWITELNMAVSGPPVSMGVRKLGKKPWLVKDIAFEKEVALKNSLSGDSSKEVFLANPGTETAGRCVVDLVRRSGVELTKNDTSHPLEIAGLSIQEDLCLLKHDSGKVTLEAASLCFPSRWRLREKISRGMNNIHAPVDGYNEHLSKKVDNFFNRLSNEPVWRRNWFIHPDNSLYQPQRPLNGDPIIEFSEIGEKLFVRSERQTLQLLDIPGWILFTIRVQRTPLKSLLLKRKEDFQKWIFEAPESHHDHKGLVVEQVTEIQKALVN